MEGYMAEDLSKISSQELQQMEANASATYAWCIGHQKAARNEILMRNYREELQARGLDVDRTIDGKANGHGSS
tara:strand:- start:105 stop:323 length:219 start_codon:yes stop_codon:yes gene_type:complete